MKTRTLNITVTKAQKEFLNGLPYGGRRALVSNLLDALILHNDRPTIINAVYNSDFLKKRLKPKPKE